MSSLAFLLASFLATLSLASPMGRQTALSLHFPFASQGSLCPWNGVPNVSNFTLLSVSRTNSSIQKPLALGLNGLSADSSVAWLGTTESIDSIIAQNFVLIDGGITAYASNGSLVAVSNPVAKENGWLSFLRPQKGVTITPAQVYCQLFNTSPHGAEFPYALAVNDGDSDNFSLCKSSTSDEYVIIYDPAQASSENAGYEWTTCTTVDVHVLPVDQQKGRRCKCEQDERRSEGIHGVGEKWLRELRHVGFRARVLHGNNF